MNMTQDVVVRACRRPGVLSMQFQPIIDTARGTVVGYESLARFSGPPHTTPDRSLAVARAAGVGPELEARALRAALHARSALPPNCFLSVNIGPDALLTAGVAAVFADAGDLRGIVVEITEQTAVANYDALATAIEPLRAAGALLAVDDAGAGFASLKHITVLRPDFVKVDRGLIAGIDKDETKAAVVEALGMPRDSTRGWSPRASRPLPNSTASSRYACRSPKAMESVLPQPMMGTAHSDAVAVCRRRRSIATYGGLFDLAEHAPHVSAIEAAPTSFARNPATTWVVVVDEHDRPVRLVDRRGGAHPPLNVLPTERLADVARRIATRPTDERHVPAVLCESAHGSSASSPSSGSSAGSPTRSTRDPPRHPCRAHENGPRGGGTCGDRRRGLQPATGAPSGLR